MHISDVNAIRKEIWRLTLAEHDMWLVHDAAEDLLGEALGSEALETGLVVAYCRSFSGPPKEGWQPQHIVDELAPEMQIHARLFEIRNKLYAHTDEDYRHRRKAVDVFGDHSHSVERQALHPELLGQVVLLAQALADRFKTAREEREATLKAAGVDPVPWPD